MATTKRKELAQMPERLTGGHAACPGCAGPMILRQALMAACQDDIAVVGAIATGCMEVTTTIYPNSAWNIPMVHSAFENAASTISGVEAAYRSFKRQGKIEKDIRFIVFGGDGGTYDIGLQALSGAMERGHDFTYICYDNGAYMNTGIQRSSATPMGAFTMTAQAGSEAAGKPQFKKDLTQIAVAHGIAYAAQASPHRPRDLMQKIQKAVRIRGPSFINTLSPCPRGWRFEPKDTIEIAQLAEETCVWPLYEVEDGEVTVNRKPRRKKPVLDWLKSQGRFEHLFEEKNRDLLDQIQHHTDIGWKKLLEGENRKLEKASQ